MKRYEYHYYINNVEVDRKTFEVELLDCFVKCDTNYSNPLLNIGYTDTKKYESVYRKLKTQKLHSYLYCTDFGGRAYRIEREGGSL